MKKLIPVSLFVPIACIFPATSCGAFNNSWDWKTSTNNNTEINYCLLIGQNDHADSIERTRYTRSALGTLDTDEKVKEKSKDNPNVADPIQGFIPVFDLYGGNRRMFVVNEIEHMEQKSMAGATWDPITANDSAGTWIAKHGNKITFFVSNNDSMAEGAYWASNWIKGLPIFGYDANSTTIQRIKAGSITGTVDQNASIQCSGAMMMMRNMLEDRDLYWNNNFDSDQAHGYGTEQYYPTYVGFYDDVSKTGEQSETYGYVNNYYVSDETTFDVGTKRQFLSNSTAIAKLEGTVLNNVDTYLKEDGSAKEPKDMVDEFTHVKDAKPSTHYNICHAYANKAEVYLVSTLRPYFNEYASRLSLDLDVVEGDGTDEAIVINQIDARPDEKFDGYLINMSKTTSTNSYVTSIAKKAFAKENKMIGSKKSTKIGHEWAWSDSGWDNFEDRLDTPLIFWNRQPHNDNGEIDSAIMNNKFFKYTYFVGVDAAQGGKVQGDMILVAISKWYTDSLNE